ncbi:MAG: molecular chaperone TorD family protein [Rhodocyclaceae bacterium]|nr:molecular chaperone TorD family protein [Rhodocyclaceae bacterium]
MTTTNPETLAAMAVPPPAYDLFRSDTYSLLGSLLSAPPNQALLDWLAELENEAPEGNRMARAWGALREAASEAIAGPVLDEFNALFVGLGRGEIVPYGSWYLTGYLMEQPLVDLREDLRGLGLEVSDDTHEPEDHVAALCQVMALLVRPDGSFDPQQQHAFFARHMQSWCERFFQDLQQCPSARFYRAVGLLGATFIGAEALQLEA